MTSVELMNAVYHAGSKAYLKRTLVMIPVWLPSKYAHVASVNMGGPRMKG